MKVTVSVSTEMDERPLAAVRSFIRGREMAVLNIGIENYEGTDGAGKTVSLYRCTTLSLTSEHRLSMAEVLKAVWENGLWDKLDAEAVRAVGRAYHVEDYDSAVPQMVAARYSVTDELGCHRKAMLGEREELVALNEFVAVCKGLASVAFEGTATS